MSTVVSGSREDTNILDWERGTVPGKPGQLLNLLGVLLFLVMLDVYKRHYY